MKNVVIVDDENLAIEELKYLLKDYPQLRITGVAKTSEEAVHTINTLKPDLVFLDVQLRNANAFDILPHLSPEMHIVFATAYDEYAIRAFEVNALDYLLKPIHPDRLKIAIQRFLMNRPSERPLPKIFRYDDKIVVNVQKGYHLIGLEEIRAITADGDYSYIVTGNKNKHIVIKSLKEWESVLPSEYFIRIHRSSIVNISYIEHIEKWFSNTCRVFLKGIDEPLTMSQRYTAAFKKNQKARTGIVK